MTSCVGMNTYRTRIGLDEPFSAPIESASDLTVREKIVDNLIEFLNSEHPDPIPRVEALPYDVKRRLLKEALTLRSPVPTLPEWFHTKMDQILQAEVADQGWVDATKTGSRQWLAFHAGKSASPQIALLQGDITRLKTDTITNAGNAELLGCFRPFHSCIDNVIHNAAGPRVREDCHTIMKLQGEPEPAGQAKITRGYNLPAKYILHTVGPIVTNVDGMFEKNGFDKDRIFTPQGDYARTQCQTPCSEATWESKSILERILPEIDPETQEVVNNEVLPRCPNCGGDVMLNVRGGDWFVEKPYVEQAEKLRNWIESTSGKMLLIVEIGAGFNTPVVIRWPNEHLVQIHPNANLIRIDLTHPDVPKEIRNKSVTIKDNAMNVITELWKAQRR